MSMINCPKCQDVANQHALYPLKEWEYRGDGVIEARVLTLMATTYYYNCATCGHSYKISSAEFTAQSRLRESVRRVA